MFRSKALSLALLAAASLAAAAARAAPPDPAVGERHLIATAPTAALRDAAHRTDLQVTVWYPAGANARTERIDLGPPGPVLFEEGAVAYDAEFADDRRRPVIVFSHGFGGSARMMAWFGTALARAGYVVVAPDHPGNNGRDQMTVAGAVLHWDRAEDLRTALAAAERDPVIGPHIDPARVGAAGFSLGGYTALLAAGARSDPGRLLAFCRAHRDDGICRPQKEFAVTLETAAEALVSPALRGEVAHAGDSHALADVRAVFALAPAVVQELTPQSLAGLRTPVTIVLGDIDPVAPPATNGQVAARLLPRVRLQTLPGVGHYEFLGTCTAQGRAVVPVCNGLAPQEPAHAEAIAAALKLFRQRLGDPGAPGDQGSRTN